jgi:hypothetical protein
MRRELADEILTLMDARPHAEPTAMEFEMAYQARVASDRIRFAIKHTEQFAPHTDQMREAALQLLDALERPESAERKFQKRFRALPAHGVNYLHTPAVDGPARFGQDRDANPPSI